MKKYLFLAIAFISFIRINAQFSISAGPSLIKGFGVQGSFPGFHIAGEYNNDDAMTYYARVGMFLSKSGPSSEITAYGKDDNISPYQFQLDSREKYNYTVIEFGKRYYFGDGYDSGFGFYGGSGFSVIFNKVQYKVGDYDASKYNLSIGDQTYGTILGLALGLNGGIKNTFHFGTIFFDAGMHYQMLSLPSNELASQTSMYSKVFFNFNLGIRRDFY